jgi:predicted acetyltransferase
MLAGACALCREGGMRRLLLTCAQDNIGSRRVIEANCGTLGEVTDSVCHYRIKL